MNYLKSAHLCMCACTQETAEEVLHEQTVLVTKDIGNNNQTDKHWQTGIF